jgi:hypothetical protein
MELGETGTRSPTVLGLPPVDTFRKGMAGGTAATLAAASFNRGM